MNPKAINTAAVPETQEILDRLPKDLAARLSPEQIEDVKKTLAMAQWIRDQDPEGAARLDALIEWECERGTM